MAYTYNSARTRYSQCMHVRALVSLYGVCLTMRGGIQVRAIFSEGLRPARFKGKIEFRDVHFAYPTDLRKKVLNGLSFVVEPGMKV